MRFKQIQQMVQNFIQKQLAKELKNCPCLDQIEIFLEDRLFSKDDPNSFFIHSSDDDWKSKMRFVKGDVTPNFDKSQKIRMSFAYGNISRILFGHQDQETSEFLCNLVKKVVKHECFHLRQIIWI